MTLTRTGMDDGEFASGENPLFADSDEAFALGGQANGRRRGNFLWTRRSRRR